MRQIVYVCTAEMYSVPTRSDTRNQTRVKVLFDKDVGIRIVYQVMVLKEVEKPKKPPKNHLLTLQTNPRRPGILEPD
jgi:hypothetical protein